MFCCEVFFAVRALPLCGSLTHMAQGESSALFTTSEGALWPLDTSHARAAGAHQVSSSQLLHFSNKTFWGQSICERITAVRSLGLCSTTRLSSATSQPCRWWVAFFDILTLIYRVWEHVWRCWLRGYCTKKAHTCLWREDRLYWRRATDFCEMYLAQWKMYSIFMEYWM